MRIEGVSARGVGQALEVLREKAASGSGGVKFGEVFERISKNGKSLGEVLGTNFQSEFANLEKTLRAGKSIPAQELLLWQLKVGQVNLRVELVSKVAESALASVRKFQNGQ